MYIFKNAFRNITRSKGRNILIGIIITVIVLCTCIALSINEAGNNLVKTYKSKTPLELSFKLDMNKLRNASDEEKNTFKSLTLDNIKDYVDSQYVKDYYYTLETTLSSDSINAVEVNERPNNENNNNDNPNTDKFKMQDIGDFRISAYSNFAYLEDFENGTKKITEGTMISTESTGNQIVISEALKEENNLKVGDEITFYIPSDTTKTFTFTIVGVYKDNTSTANNSFMSMNAMNSSNQLYTNTTKLQEILSATTNENNNKLIDNNGLTAKIYLNNDKDLSAYKKEVNKKGLNSYYSISTNKEEVESTLKPIKNITNFSFTFLIVILIIGIVVLSVINFLNIRERKYEIGVLRSIGMSKGKVTLLFVTEIFIIAMIGLIIGTTSATIVSQPITNKILENEISSFTEQSKNIENNFGNGDFQKPSEKIQENNKFDHRNTNNKNTANYVDSLKVHLNITTILKLFVITIILTISSGIIATFSINKYNPNKILQNRS